MNKVQQMKFFRQPRNVRFIGIGLLIISLVISGFLYFAAEKAVETAANQQFEYEINKAQLQIEGRISDYEDIIRGLKALFQTTAISRLEFRRYVNGLDLKRKFPGIQNFNFAPYVSRQDKETFEKRVQQDTSVRPEGYPQFKIRPPGGRDAYYVLTYIEPYESFTQWMGEDIGAKPKVAEALARSRDTGELTSSGRVIQVGGPEKRVALAMRMPLYRIGMPTGSVEERRAAYYGSVGAGFDVRRLMEGALDETTLSKLSYKLYDMGDKASTTGSSDDRLLFESAPLSAKQQIDKKTHFTAVRSMKVGGRIWETHFTASKYSMMPGFNRYLPAAILGCSLLLSLLLLNYMYNLRSSRRHALELASHMTKDLRENEALLEDSQQMAHLGNWSLDMPSGEMTWSTEACRIFGRDTANRNVQYAEFIRHLHEHDRKRIITGIQNLFETGGEFCTECRIVTGHGALHWIEMIIRSTDEGPAKPIRGTVMDVTLRKRLEIQTSIEYRITRLVATSEEIDTVIPKIIEILCTGFGWLAGIYRTAPETGGHLRYSHHWHPDFPAMQAFINTQKHGDNHVYRPMLERAWSSHEPVVIHRSDTPGHAHRSDGEIFIPPICIAFSVRSGDRAYGVMQCFTEDLGASIDELKHILQLIGNHIGQFVQRKTAEAALNYIAAHDSLTDLLNRNMFNQSLEHAIARESRYGRGVAVMFIDLDRFKLINDTKGHTAGDQVLQECARRLTQCLRDSDIVARLGGDEFAVLLEQYQQPTDLGSVATKVLDAFKRPYWLSDQEYLISASIGISTFPSDGADVGTLLRNADAAMYRAKSEGSGYQFYSMEMNEHSKARFEMEVSLRHAIENNEFLLHYQPKVDLHSGHAVGLEALIRWKHPQMGMVSPAAFIPLAEETGTIIEIGHWVLKEACKQTKAWQDAGLGEIRVAVNLSARQFNHQTLLQDIAQTLEDTGLPSSSLELELTESMVMQNAEQAIKLLAEIKSLGIYLSIDDFGTGYSSLAYLRKFAVDCIKIDRAFIKDIPVEADDMAISSSIISLGHSLRLKVVAEGVETSEQLAFLKEMDCDEIQGYYFSKPLPAAEIPGFLARFHQKQEDVPVSVP